MFREQKNGMVKKNGEYNRHHTCKSCFNKETRREAMKMLRQDYGITGQLEDLSFRELELFMRYAQFIKDAEDEVGKL